jgi:putative ATPase
MTFRWRRAAINIFELVVNASADMKLSPTIGLHWYSKTLYDKSGEQQLWHRFGSRASDPNGAVYSLPEWLEEKTWNLSLEECLFYQVKILGTAKPYCFHNGQQHFSSSYNNRLSRKPDHLKPMCHLFSYVSKKKYASYLAIGTAQQLVKQTGDLPVPSICEMRLPN